MKTERRTPENFDSKEVNWLNIMDVMCEQTNVFWCVTEECKGCIFDAPEDEFKAWFMDRIKETEK